MNVHSMAWFLAGAVIVLPFVAVLPLMLLGGVGRQPSERVTSTLVLALCGLSAIAGLALTALWFHSGGAPIVLQYGSIFDLGLRGHVFNTGAAEGYRFKIDLLVDRLSITMMLLTAGLTWITARFSVRYLHREAGFFRYFCSSVCSPEECRYSYWPAASTFYSWVGNWWASRRCC